MFCADDLTLVTESPDSARKKIKALKDALKLKGSRVNVKKTKVMISNEKARKLRKEG